MGRGGREEGGRGSGEEGRGGRGRICKAEEGRIGAKGRDEGGHEEGLGRRGRGLGRGLEKDSSVGVQEQERNVLLEQLDVALRDEAELHRKESQRLNEELYLQEKKTCDSYVEKRLLQVGQPLWEGRSGGGEGANVWDDDEERYM